MSSVQLNTTDKLIDFWQSYTGLVSGISEQNVKKVLEIFSSIFGKTLESCDAVQTGRNFAYTNCRSPELNISETKVWAYTGESLSFRSEDTFSCHWYSIT